MSGIDLVKERENQVISKLQWFVDTWTEQTINLTKEEVIILIDKDHRQEGIIREMSQYLDEVLDKLSYWLELPEQNNVFNFIIENWEIEFKYISRALKKLWVNEEDLLEQVIDVIWKNNFIKEFKDKKSLDLNGIRHTHYSILINWTDFNVSISLTRDFWEDLYGIYLTPMRVFKSSLIDNFEWFLAAASVKDSETDKHLDRTKHYTRLLTTELKNRWLFTDVISDGFIENVSISAPLHDIWKIFVDERILKKPWKLNMEEYLEMKEHTTNWAILMEAWFSKYSEPELKNLILIAINIVNFHHERYDGSWYPEWLIWEKIPLEARILAIVDVFDALISKRCYKQNWSPEDTKKELQNEAWKHFDPVLVEVFLDLFDDMLEIRNEFKD